VSLAAHSSQIYLESGNWRIVLGESEDSQPRMLAQGAVAGKLEFWGVWGYGWGLDFLRSICDAC
jgi:hypothetical protein